MVTVIICLIWHLIRQGNHDKAKCPLAPVDTPRFPRILTHRAKAPPTWKSVPTMTEQFAITVTASTRHGVISSVVLGGGFFCP